MSERRYLHLNLVANDLNLHHGAPSYERAVDPEAADLMFPAGAGSVREFIDEVVPRLVDRGSYPKTPDDRPLRERFGRGDGS
jgi:hypothetical protein